MHGRIKTVHVHEHVHVNVYVDVNFHGHRPFIEGSHPTPTHILPDLIVRVDVDVLVLVDGSSPS